MLEEMPALQSTPSHSALTCTLAEPKDHIFFHSSSQLCISLGRLDINEPFANCLTAFKEGVGEGREQMGVSLLVFQLSAGRCQTTASANSSETCATKRPLFSEATPGPGWKGALVDGRASASVASEVPWKDPANGTPSRDRAKLAQVSKSEEVLYTMYLCKETCILCTIMGCSPGNHAPVWGKVVDIMYPHGKPYCLSFSCMRNSPSGALLWTLSELPRPEHHTEAAAVSKLAFPSRSRIAGPPEWKMITEPMQQPGPPPIG